MIDVFWLGLARLKRGCPPGALLDVEQGQFEAMAHADLRWRFGVADGLGTFTSAEMFLNRRWVTGRTAFHRHG